MKRISSIIIVLMMLALLTSACNGDIFIDAEDLPDVTALVIEGDGGQWSSAFSRKGLVRIHLDSDEKEFVTYYGRDGKTVDADCPPSELESIVYETPKRYYTIGFEGDMVYITSYYNASYAVSVMLSFDYEYGATKVIHLTLTEGERLEMVSWTLSGPMKLEENFGKSTHVASFTNNGPLAQQFGIMPFLQSNCSRETMPSDFWAHGLILDMPVPVYNFDDGKWEWREYENIMLGDRMDGFIPEYFGHKLMVDVPANTTVKVSYTLNYSRAIQKGVLQFYNAAAKQNFETTVTWTSVYAVSYDYTVEYE